MAYSCNTHLFIVFVIGNRLLGLVLLLFLFVVLDHLLFLGRIELLSVVIAAFHCQSGPTPSVVEVHARPVATTVQAR